MMLSPQELVRRAVEGELKKGDRFHIYTNGRLDTIKILEFDVDETGTKGFLCVEKEKWIADSSIIVGNTFEPI